MINSVRENYSCGRKEGGEKGGGLCLLVGERVLKAANLNRRWLGSKRGAFVVDAKVGALRKGPP